VGLTESIKTYFCTIDLRRNTTGKREVRAINLNDVRNFSVLFDFADEQQYNQILEKIDTLKTNYSVKAIGYTAISKVPHYVQQKLNFEVLCKKDVNWFGKPKKASVDAFYTAKTDVLINLSLYNYAVLDYISKRSNALFKLGAFNEKNKEFLDLMINLSEDQGVDVLMDECLHYLQLINK